MSRRLRSHAVLGHKERDFRFFVHFRFQIKFIVRTMGKTERGTRCTERILLLLKNQVRLTSSLSLSRIGGDTQAIGNKSFFCIIRLRRSIGRESKSSQRTKNMKGPFLLSS